MIAIMIIQLYFIVCIYLIIHSEDDLTNKERKHINHTVMLDKIIQQKLRRGELQ